MTDPLQRRVSIDVELTRPRSPKEQLPSICVLGIVPMDAPVIAKIAPQTVIRKSLAEGSDQPYVEHVRLSSPVQQVLLPAISMRSPSKLRSSLLSILEAKCPEVDFILARAPSLQPWDLNLPSVVEMFIPYLNATQGAVVVLPDAGGPWPRVFSQRSDEYERIKRLHGTVHMYSPLFVENYQVGFMDIVAPTEARQLDPFFFSLRGADVSLCSWTGSFAALKKHGWKSASACFAGHLASKPSYITQSLVGHNIQLGKGRTIIDNRSRLLGASNRFQHSQDLDANCILLDLNDRQDKAKVQSEMTFRNPMYEWAIPAVRTVKSIHMSLRRTADQFVFRPVRQTEALILQAAMENVLRPFYESGVLVGPDGKGPPDVKAEPIPSQSAPMLSVDLAAQIRPWCQNISLKVMVKEGASPIIQES